MSIPQIIRPWSIIVALLLVTAGNHLPAGEALSRGGKPPAEDDTLLDWYTDDPDTLNVVIASDSVSDEMHRRACEFLAQRKFTNPEEWEPCLAESWTFDKDKLEYTIKLRKGVMWHPITRPDGKVIEPVEFTAKDVKFTFDCILNKNVEAAHIRSYYEDPDAKDESQRYKIKVSLVPTDKYTVKIRWTKPYFLADDFTLQAVQMIPRHVFTVDETGEPFSSDISSKEFADGFNKHWANSRICGTGPMMLKDWQRKKQFVFERNPNYWGKPSFFSRVTYNFNSNNNTVLQKVLQNEWDFSVIAEKDLYLKAVNSSEKAEGKINTAAFDYPAYRYMGYNLRRELFKDKRVRAAIGHAVPVDQIIDKIFHGLAVRTTGPFIPASEGYDTSLKPLELDLEKARQLLDESGWKDTNGDGVRDRTIGGKRVDAEFDLIIYNSAPQYQLIAELIRENCQKLGIKVTISPVDWPAMLQKLRKKDFDAAILGWAMDYKQDPFQLWHSSQAEVPESSNYGGYANPVCDKLIGELRPTLDPAKQNELMKKIHRVIYDDQPYTFLYCDKRTAAYSTRLENINFYKIRPAYDNREWFSNRPRAAK